MSANRPRPSTVVPSLFLGFFFSSFFFFCVSFLLVVSFFCWGFVKLVVFSLGNGRSLSWQMFVFRFSSLVFFSFLFVLFFLGRNKGPCSVTFLGGKIIQTGSQPRSQKTGGTPYNITFFLRLQTTCLPLCLHAQSCDCLSQSREKKRARAAHSELTKRMCLRVLFPSNGPIVLLVCRSPNASREVEVSWSDNQHTKRARRRT